MPLHDIPDLVGPIHVKVVIIEVRHEEQIFASSSKERLDARSGDVRDVELLVASFWNI
jgi:hypothetical protein